MELIQDVPIVYMLAAAAIVFAMVPTALLRIDDWNKRRQIEHKIHFSNVFVGRDIETIDGEARVVRFQLGIYLANTANSLVSYDVKFISTSVDNQINQEPSFENTGGLVAPQTVSLFRDAVISMGAGGVMPGRFMAAISFEVEYGLPDKKRRYTMAHDLRITIIMSDDGQVRDTVWLYRDEGR